MINSCLLYGTLFLKSSFYNDYVEILGQKRVLELYDEQTDYFCKCIVIPNTYIDSDGVSYNSLVEPNEQGLIEGTIIKSPTYHRIDETNESYFTIELLTSEDISFSLALSSQVTHDYEKYSVGREISVKTERTPIGIYQINKVLFKDKIAEIEM